MDKRPVELKRETYRKIKGYTREEMIRFLTELYNTAYEEAAGKAVDFDELKAEIGQIKGIGEARLNEIMAVIEKHLSSDDKSEE